MVRFRNALPPAPVGLDQGLQHLTNRSTGVRSATCFDLRRQHLQIAPVKSVDQRLFVRKVLRGRHGCWSCTQRRQSAMIVVHMLEDHAATS